MENLPLTIFQSLAITIALALQSCSSDVPKTTVSESEPEVASKTEKKGCCFTKREDFAPFIPSGNTLLTIHGSKEFAASFYCGTDDDPNKSSANIKYEIDKEGTTDRMQSKFISLQIEDFCSDPGRLVEEIKRRSTNAEKAATQNKKITVNRIEKKGVYSGYTWMDSSSGNNASNVELFVEVGGRFRIHIQGIDHNRMDALNQLFEMIPTEKLAAF